jgi:hypothetical protein
MSSNCIATLVKPVVARKTNLRYFPDNRFPQNNVETGLSLVQKAAFQNALCTVDLSEKLEL